MDVHYIQLKLVLFLSSTMPFFCATGVVAAQVEWWLHAAGATMWHPTSKGKGEAQQDGRGCVISCLESNPIPARDAQRAQT